MALTQEWERRVNHWRNTLPRLFYRELVPVAWSGFTTLEQLAAAEAAKGRFRPMPVGSAWGQMWEYGWFRATVRLPAAAAGERIVLMLDVWSRDGSATSEAAIYVNGVHAGARDLQHRHLTLSRKARGGDAFELLIEAYAGHGPQECGGGPVPDGVETVPLRAGTQARVGASSIGIWDEAVYQLWVDMEALWQLREQLTGGVSLRLADVEDALKQLTLVVDLELPRAEMLRTVAAGRALLKPVLAARNGSSAPFMHAFGHAHIDIAWLWPLRETESKCVRTFSTQLAMMEEYPEYKFLQSQPHLYDMVKRHYPDLYARIKRAVKRGQWIAEGGMWVEADTNLSGGESLIRQFLHGKRFFREEFGVESELMWLPDVFGYSAALPQIMAGCGIRYFSTQKIFWTYNGGDPFPYNAFWWEGLDGSRTLAYIHNDYNSSTHPQALCTRWKERVQKDSTHRGRLLPFGHGDGGGGATRDHLEFLRRAEDLEGVPRCRIGHPVDYFHSLDPKRLPSWVGELYFQCHRGTYTSQARTKQGNRRSEFGLREAELWACMAQARRGARVPLADLRGLWQAVLLNQFHDIIPGSSIERVYVEAEAAYAKVIQGAAGLAQGARRRLVRTDRAAVTVFNALSWSRPALVRLPEGFEGAATMDGTVLPTQRTPQGVLARVADVPACGMTTLRRAPAGRTANVLRVSPTLLENEHLRVTLDAAGEITEILDKEADRVITAGTANAFRLYKDVPNWFDAWDIDSMYKDQPVALARQATVRVLARGPLVASLHVRRALGASMLTQEIRLRAGSRRLDFVTTVDWRERHKLLKVEFPVNVHSEDALHEIQFGHVRRPTHASKPFDAARFEVCHHKWSALVEEGRGAAVLNDCKYGISVEDNRMALTLLKSALAPDMHADQGEHTFTYALYSWNGAFSESGVVREAYDLNAPVVLEPGAGGHESLLSLSASNVMLEAVKPADDGSGDVILRLYECMRTATRTTLHLALPVKGVAETDMLEARVRDVPLSAGACTLEFRPFEIKTLRLTLAGKPRGGASIA